jgi:septum formation protein
MMDLILASGSPRRKELLEKLQLPFVTVPSDEDEQIDLNRPSDAVVIELARRKAESVAARFPAGIVIGADTIVVFDGQILGKPKDRGHARTMLRSLSGRTHSVYTGVAICSRGGTETFFEKTDVTFWALSQAEIERYLDSGEPFDKAGAYGIQGLGALLVEKIRGDFYTVMGLPIARLHRVLSTNPKYAALYGPSTS